MCVPSEHTQTPSTLRWLFTMHVHVCDPESKYSVSEHPLMVTTALATIGLGRNTVDSALGVIVNSSSYTAREPMSFMPAKVCPAELK